MNQQLSDYTFYIIQDEYKSNVEIIQFEQNPK